MSKPKSPTPPDPQQTAAAQTASNVNTAVANAYMGNVNQITPDGSLTYSQTGQKQVHGPNGDIYDVPIFTATQTLSPQQQAIKSQTDAAELNLGRIANEQTGKLRNYLNEPVSLDNKVVEDRLMELGRTRLDPLLERQRETLNTNLSNRGVMMGSDEYAEQINLDNQARNDAYVSLLLNGRNQAINEVLTQRNQPLNEITALLSGSQVSQPNFVPTSMPTIPTTDVAGITQQGFNNQMGIYQQKSQNYSDLMGGLFNLGRRGLQYGMS